MTKEMEALADKICKEELGQEPSDNNEAFGKVLVHGMVRWDEEIQAHIATLEKKIQRWGDEIDRLNGII